MKAHFAAMVAALAVALFAAPAGAQQNMGAPPRDAANSGTTTTAKPIANYVPVTDATLLNPNPNDWLMMRRTYESYGHSPLTQINKENVKNLQLVWARSMEPGINEGTPLVHQGVMFLINPADVVQAIDAATGQLLWQYRRKLPTPQQLHGVWGQRKRSLALYNDKVYFVSWDNFLVALDAKTGKALWETDRGGDLYATNTNGPIIVDGVVIAGGNCQVAGFGCPVTGNDAETGKELWRKTFIPKKGEPGDETWGGTPFESRWMTGVWGAITYDPETKLVYFGTSSVGPASEAQRGQIGATLEGTDTRFAVLAKTGKTVWKRQLLPRDNFDMECTFEMLPITLKVQPDPKAEGMMAVNPRTIGVTRRTLTGAPCKTGIVWSLDAKTGEFFWAKQTAYQNIVTKIDPKGAVTINESIAMTDLNKTYHHCPAHGGGRNWPFSAYSPRNKTLYVQIQNTCADYTARTDRTPTPAMEYNTAGKYLKADGKDNLGRIDAVSVETGKTLWSWETPVSNYSPILSTESGLLFNGGMDRYLRAFDQDTGKVLWETRLASQVFAATVTFALNGRQYIAVAAGGGYNGGPLPLTPDADALSGNNAVYVFALPQ